MLAILMEYRRGDPDGRPDARALAVCAETHTGVMDAAMRVIDESGLVGRDRDEATRRAIERGGEALEGNPELDGLELLVAPGTSVTYWRV